MKLFLSIVMIFMFSVVAFAAKSELSKDGLGVKFSTFAPDGNQTRVLTVNSTKVNMNDNVQYAIFALQSSCRFRIMSSNTKVGNSRYLPKGNVYQRGVNKKSPFVNTTSCTNCILELQ